MVFYRKYRPQKLSELDKEGVRSRLTTIFKTGRTPHSFLFAGPKGTGKTSAARIIAKLINCENKGKDGEPCNKCQACRDITRGMHVDIFEIDAASNRGIDEIRDLREKINLSPASAKYKVYIIDEVHMLTREAFNALLKTLEEPPSHVVFILATTEVHRLPDTIISRCIKLNFAKADNAEILRSLKRVASFEKLPIQNDALEIIAKFSDGSFRDAVKTLEQAAVEEKFKASEIQELIGLAGSFEEFLQFVFDKKTKEALLFIQEKVEQGANMKIFLEAVLEDLHARLVEKYRIETGNWKLETGRKKLETGSWKSDKTADRQETGEKSQTKKSEIGKEELKKLIILLSKAHQEMKASFIEELPLELAVIEWGEH